MGTLHNKNTESQCKSILKHLQCGKSINPIEALNKYGCFRLGARIYDLKQEGHQIKKEMVAAENGKKYASYTMERC